MNNIITCPSCSHRLSMVKDAGLTSTSKLRCRHCQHIFTHAQSLQKTQDLQKNNALNPSHGKSLTANSCNHVQCPSCQHTFTLPKGAIITPFTKLRCGHCQSVFTKQASPQKVAQKITAGVKSNKKPAANTLKCPNCSQHFTLPKTAKITTQTKLRCGHCQHVFTQLQSQTKPCNTKPVPNGETAAITSQNQANKQAKPANSPQRHTANTQPKTAPKAATASTKQPLATVKPLNSTHLAKNSLTKPTKQTAATPSHNKPLPSADTLIHDDMMIDDDDDQNKATTALSSDFDSLDAMSSWLDQQIQQKPPKPDTTTSGNVVDDDAWVQALLAEEQLKEAENHRHQSLQQKQQAANAPINREDNLNQLLQAYGVQSIDNPPATTPLEIADKINARLQKRPSSQQLAQKKPAIITGLWCFGCVILIGGLIAQYAIFNLDNLVKNPHHAKKLHNICQLLSCQIPHADLSAYVVSDLHYQSSKIKPATNHTDIRATLHNHSSTEQLYPNLKVQIYQKQQLIGEFVAAPKDYLDSPQKQLNQNQMKQFMLTVPLAKSKISHVTIEPFY